MGFFNATAGWPSFNAITEAKGFVASSTGVIHAGSVVTLDSTTDKFGQVGNAASAAFVPYIAIYDSTDLDIAKTDNDTEGMVAKSAKGTSGGNLATLSLSQTLEFETNQYIGTPASGAFLTYYGVASGETTAASLGKFRVAATGEPIIARVIKAAAVLREDASVTVIRAVAMAHGSRAA